MKRVISAILMLSTLMTCLVFTVSAENSIISDEGRMPFDDIKQSYWFYEAAEFCYANGIIKGMDKYTFGAAVGLTRAQLVVMLSNLEDVDTSRYTVRQFKDVKSDHWYYGAVAWAYNEGIVSGITENNFSPNTLLNRAQLAVIMYNYMSKSYEVEVNDRALDGFSDKPKVDYWYYDAMKYAVSAELIQGNSNGTLAPTDTVSRGQAVVFFKSFIQMYFHGACQHDFSDADCTHPSVCVICGMATGLANGHRLAEYDCASGGECNVCEQMVDPSAILHDFAPATCDMPQCCSRCGETRGEALGHTVERGICHRCGRELFRSVEERIIYYLVTNGKYDPADNSYYIGIGHRYSVSRLVYNKDQKGLIMENVYYAPDGDVFITEVGLFWTAERYNLLYTQISNDEYVLIGKGNMGGYTKDTELELEIYWTLNHSFDPNPGLNAAVKEMMADVNNMLYDLCGYTVADVGYFSYIYKNQFPHI